MKHLKRRNVILLAFILFIAGSVLLKTLKSTCSGFGLAISLGCIKAAFTYTNRLDNSSISWSKNWKNYKSTESGNEVNFSLTGGKSLILSASFAENTPQQKLHILFNSTAYTLQPDNKEQSVIYIQQKEDFKNANVRIWHYCEEKDDCNVTIRSINMPKTSTIARPLVRKKTMVIFGDSITQLYERDNYSYRLADRLGVVLINAGVYGSTVAPVKGLDHSLLRYDSIILNKADIIIVLIGTNDLAYGVNQKDFRFYYKNLLSAIKKTNPQAKIYTPGILKRRDLDVLPFNAIISEIAQELDIIYINTTSWLLPEDLKDEVHPSLESQEKLVEKFLETIETDNTKR